MKRVFLLFFLFIFCLSGLPTSIKSVETLPKGTKADTLQWTEKYVEKAEKMNLFDQNDTRNPFDPVSRGDFIRWLVKAKNYSLSPSTHSFEDLEPTHPNYAYIMTAVEKGVVAKTALFRPNDLLIRSDASLWLVQAHSEMAQEKAKSITEPLIPAQDGYFDIPKEAIGSLTVCYLPQYQMMEYRHLENDDFRYIQPDAPIILGEAAYSLYQLTHPPAQGGKIIAAVPMEPRTLFSGLDTMSSMTDIISMIYEIPIGGYDDYWSNFPLLIKRIPTQENGLWVINQDSFGEIINMEVTFELRTGLKWADGTPLTADDCVFAFYLYNHPSFPTIHTEMDLWIDKIETLDDQTVKMTWNTPYLYCTSALNVMPRHYFEEKYGYHLEPFDLNDKTYYESDRFYQDEEFINLCSMDEYNTNPLHTGPYKVSTWEEGKKIILKPNPYYLFGPPLIDEIEIQVIENTDLILSRAIKDQIDMTWSSLSFDQATQLVKKNGQHKALFTPSLTWEHIDLNVDDPVLSDSRVRKALLYAIDRQSITDHFFGGIQPVAHAWLPPRHNAYVEENITKYEWDMQKAGTLLDEAGWKLNTDGMREKEGKVLTITFMTTSQNKTREQVQAVIASSWKELGIDVITENQQSSTFFIETLRERDFQGPTAFMYAWIMGPASNLYSILSSSQIPTEENAYSGQNYTGYKNTLVDELLLENLISLDTEKIYQNLREIQAIVTQDLPSLPLYYRVDVSSANQNIVNYKPTGTYYSKTWNSAYWYWQEDETPKGPPHISILNGEKELVLGQLLKDSIQEQKIRIKNTGESPLKGTIESDSPFVIFRPNTFHLKKEETTTITAKFQANLIPNTGPFSGVIHILTNDPDLPLSTISFKGIYGSILVLKIGKKSATLNDQRIPMDIPPIIREGRTLVPLRFIGETFSAQVKWIPEPDKEIQLDFKEKRIRLWIGKNKALIEPLPPNKNPAKEVNLDAPPQLLEGRTIIPLRFVAENMDAKVEWDSKDQSITIWFIEP